MFEEELKPFPTWLSTSVGLTLIILGSYQIQHNKYSRYETLDNYKTPLFSGIGSKMGAIYGTGYNTYYWYDMVTNIPNAYFVKVILASHWSILLILASHWSTLCCCGCLTIFAATRVHVMTRGDVTQTQTRRSTFRLRLSYEEC